MLTIRIIRQGRESYYLTPESEELPWLLGSGADLLELHAESLHWQDDRLKLILQGIHPTTHRYLSARSRSTRHGIDRKTGKEKLYKPVAGYDLVANAPKDVSILALALGEHRAVELHEVATERALGELENFCVARGKGRVAPVILVQTHRANRSLEPHLHTHALILNLGLASPDKAYCLEGRQLLQAVHPLGQLYRNHLRGLLESELGLSTYPVPLQNGESFSIRGIPESLRQAFSTRSEPIREYKKRKPKASATELRLIALKTREPKQEIPLPALERQWREQAAEHALTLNREMRYQEYER